MDVHTDDTRLDIPHQLMDCVHLYAFWVCFGKRFKSLEAPTIGFVHLPRMVRFHLVAHVFS